MGREFQRQEDGYLEHLLDAFGKNNTYQPSGTAGITRASNDCYAVCGFLRREMEALDTALDGGNREQVISFEKGRGGLDAGGGAVCDVPARFLRGVDEGEEGEQYGHSAAGAGHGLL